ncbi:MAG: ribosome maturation factor RimM [Steroidobacteraceae bacterium]
MGRIVAPHGVRGDVRVQSYADPPEALLDHRHWVLRRTDGSEQGIEVLDARWDGHVLRATLAGIGDRDAAERLRGSEVLLSRDELPAPRAHEYYREDLLGFTVRNGTGAVLGTLLYFLEGPAGALMVVRGQREYWLPAGPPHLRRVDTVLREVEVDWPADF